MIYHADGLRAVHARNLDAAARIFAHRLGRGLFGRSGGFVGIQRVFPEQRRPPRRAGIFRVKLRGSKGLRSWVQFLVIAQGKT